MKITGIEVVNHSYNKIRCTNYYSVFYSSGRIRTYKGWDSVPETVKSFIRCHYDVVAVDDDCRTIYSYRAINRIE